MVSGRFEVGMVIPAWSPRAGVGSAGAVLVVAVSADRRTAWLADAKRLDSPLGPQRHDIVWDERFGEKIVAFPNFSHREFRVFRADKATGRMEVPKEVSDPTLKGWACG